MNPTTIRRPALDEGHLAPEDGMSDVGRRGQDPTDGPTVAPNSDEALVADLRASLSPAQMVERKLLSLLHNKAVPVSHVRMSSLPSGRTRGSAPVGLNIV